MACIVIVDENDTPIGVKERGEIDAAKDRYRVTGLWLTNSKGDILLAQRALTKKVNPGLWGPAVAGTVEEGETYDENIVKEIREELGIRLSITDLKKVKKFRVDGPRHYFSQFYTYTADTPAPDFAIARDGWSR